MSAEKKKIVDGIIEFEQGTDPKPPKMEVLPPVKVKSGLLGGTREWVRFNKKAAPITKTIWRRLQELQPNTDRTKLIALADKIIEMALNGDRSCMQIILDRIDGKLLFNFGGLSGDEEPSLASELSDSNGNELDTLRLVVNRVRARAVDHGGEGSLPAGAPKAGVQDKPAGGVSEPRPGEAEAEISQS